MSGRSSQRKGRTFELAVAEMFRKAGFKEAKAMGLYEPGDVRVPINGQDMTIECKCSKRGRGGFYPLLEASHAVVHKADRQEPLITMPLSMFFNLRGQA